MNNNNNSYNNNNNISSNSNNNNNHSIVTTVEEMSMRMATMERLMLLMNERLGFGLNPPSVQEMLVEGDAGIMDTV